MPTALHSTFAEWFARFASTPGDAKVPRQWQEALARDEQPRSRVIRIPTGYGKTLGVLGAWLYHRVERADERWPRRLVWTLPMRVLVEQTASEVRACLDRLGLLWTPGADHRGKVGVHLLMGGVAPGGEWNLYPEEAAVLIATQDMSLSRALNRGYAAPRARWPMELGLLSQDVLWVLDEVQLMDVGLATSAQLQAYLDDDEDAGRNLRPRMSWWMSATLQPSWLDSIDTRAHHGRWTAAPTTLSTDALRSGLALIQKQVEMTAAAANDAAAFAALVRDAHQRASGDGEYGRITLVVCNTVERASRTYAALEKLGMATDLRLVHSRYRPRERANWAAEFLSRSACNAGVDRVIVATQVVEAGVDISATTLVTELAPWSSLVQRFGRCARYGGSGRVLVVDRGRDAKATPPYASADLDAAQAAVEAIAASTGDVGIASLEAFERELSDDRRASLYPYQPAHLLLRREFDELFDTTPDLSGADIDISRFIRTGDERDVSVFWLDVAALKKGEAAHVPPPERKPSRDELCAVPFLLARDWLCGKATKEKPATRLLPTRRAWVWDWLDGEWKIAERSSLNPGALVCVAADSGGYRTDRGFDPESKADVEVLSAPQADLQDTADDLEDSEELSAAAYKTIATHNREVAELAREIVADLVPARISELVQLAGRWHDLGKVHPAFQAAIVDRGPYRSRDDLAKAPRKAWQRPCMYRSAGGETRRGFRHELASCLALFAILQRHATMHAALLGPWGEALTLMGDAAPVPSQDPGAPLGKPTPLEAEVLACTADEFDLVAYLVLSHHGKVRVAMHAGPKDQEYVARDGRGLPIRGVREGDVLPSIALEDDVPLPPLRLSLTPAALGLSRISGRSWRDRSGALLRAHGPGALAYLEALLIAADRRASKLMTADPLLAEMPAGGLP
jgi:CRISPR-associated endonuclease/helicase Cas3